MFNLIKIIGVAIAGGAVAGALGSSKLGSFLRRDEDKVRAKRTQVKIVEVQVDADDPGDLEFIVVKRNRGAKKTKHTDDE